MKTVEDLTELSKIRLNRLFIYNNYILQASRSRMRFYCFDTKKNIGCELYKRFSICPTGICVRSRENLFWYIRIMYRIILDE